MFCPQCNAYLIEADLIKLNIVYAPGSVPVEYDAQCPVCEASMGRVFWGKLAVNPPPSRHQDPEKENPKEAAPPAGDTHEPAERQKHCPHCGKSLPEGL